MVVDSLPQLVIAMDEQARITRVNRTIETWGMGKVNKVDGLYISDFLKCFNKNYADDAWTSDWPYIWQQIQNKDLVERKIEKHIGKTYLYTLRKIPDYDVNKDQCFAVLVIDDITTRQDVEKSLKSQALQLEKEINARTLELKQSNEQLEYELQAQKIAKEELRQSQECRLNLLRDLFTTQEKERKRIACELHDSIGQSLGATKFKIEELLMNKHNFIDDTEYSQFKDLVETIKNEVSLSGVGLHTGNTVNMTFKPAPINHGYAFARVDLEGEPIIAAKAEFVVNTQRGTNLEKNGVQIQTSEHVLAAAVGLGIDNLLIEIDASEPPIMDGSSKFFVEALEKAGIEEQDAAIKEYIVKDIISYRDEVSGSEIILMPSDKYEITTMVDFGTKILGTQNATLQHISDFKEEIAAARTFSFLHEIEMLLENDLIKGGDLNNAIVYVDKELSAETMGRLKKAFKKEDIAVQSNGILDNLNLHWANEAARHKLLDVIGDLALTGIRIRGKVIANKPGHLVNTQFAKKLSKIIKAEKRNNVPQIDLNQPPLMDIHQIMDILPHRPPFLLIDRILELSDKHVVGMKNVTMNENFFVGHFPGAPVMPGVLQVEAMAQCGGVLVLSTVPDPENYLTYFMKMDNVKFKQKVLPGDTLIFKCELISPIRRGICHMQAYGYANGKLVVEAELMAQIAKK